MSLRAFVALEISDPALDSLVGFEEELRATGADIKLVERQNLHFTVKFLAEISESQAAEVGSRLGNLRLKGVEVEVRGAGAFPNPSKARVVWAGVSRDHESLVAALSNIMHPQMTVLVKGSRIMQMERVVTGIVADNIPRGKT